MTGGQRRPPQRKNPTSLLGVFVVIGALSALAAVLCH